jgi:hypothetical protein
MPIIRILLLTFVLLIRIAVILSGQTIPFDKTVRSFEEIDVQPENRITILTHTIDRYTGHFVSYSGTDVLFRNEANELQTMPLSAIAYFRVDPDKSRRALNYGMYGAFAGLFAGIPVGARISNNKREDESANDTFIYIGAALGSAVAGGLIGTGIGLAVLPGETVYRIAHDRID